MSFYHKKSNHNITCTALWLIDVSSGARVWSVLDNHMLKDASCTGKKKVITEYKKDEF